MAKVKEKQIEIANLSLPDAKKILPKDVIDLSDLKLNPKQFRFVVAYLSNGFNMKRAYEAAGYSIRKKELVNANAWNLLQRNKIQEAISRVCKASLGPYKEQLELRIVETYYRRAFYTLDKFYDNKGKLLPLNQIDDEWKIVIDGVQTRRYGNKGSLKQMEYVLADRSDALRQLYQYVQTAKGIGEETADLTQDKREEMQMIFNRLSDGIKQQKDVFLPFRKVSGSGKGE